MPANELAALIGRIAATDGVHPTAIGPVTLYRSSMASEPCDCVYEPALCVVAQGSKRVLLGEEAYVYDPSHFLLVSVGLPVVGQVTTASSEEPYLAAKIDLDLGQVGELMADAPVAIDAEPPGRGLTVSTLDPPLLDAVSRLVGLLETPRDVPALAPLVLREIAYRLLTGEQGGRLRRIAAEGGLSQRVARAIEWIRRRYAEPFRIEDVAKAARMSPSTLHQHFKAVTAMSPLQYQKRLRLQEARRLMLVGGLDAAEAAYRVGYESPSQFSREYRRAFGEPPARDLARLRAAPSPAGA
ncbi:AraC family transcriptional regulator [Paludisphaera soli]|uniref:AraC family transcriptional regulator n=1 Tax=Paludisphaera soli TaxID=2712865 RepID=UPI0013E9C321|nr:AraC family transcriptional regulator [Paludisphaera soli]